MNFPFFFFFLSLNYELEAVENSETFGSVSVPNGFIYRSLLSFGKWEFFGMSPKAQIGPRWCLVWWMDLNYELEAVENSETFGSVLVPNGFIYRSLLSFGKWEFFGMSPKAQIGPRWCLVWSMDLTYD
jgi:hypothetical protein